MKKAIIAVMALAVFSCKKQQKPAEQAAQAPKKEFKSGVYRGELTVKDRKFLPFNFTVNPDKTMVVYNAEERIDVDEISVKGDSVYIHMPVYDAHLTAKLLDNGDLSGFYFKGPKNVKVDFKATFGDNDRFKAIKRDTFGLEGAWEVTFSPGTEYEYKAKGVFKDKEHGEIHGTFLTETGDYRFLDGLKSNNGLRLSCFDGSHAFLFDAQIKGDSLVNGMFYSGNHYSEPWVAVRNDKFELADPESLTFLNEGYDSVDFSFPGLDGTTISLKDKRFEGKAVVIQLMGSWCPNCLDESTFLSTFYKENKPEDLEVVALAFEYAKTKEKAFNNLKRLKERLGISYPIALAQFGGASKEKAAEKLPMLNHVLSYPTTIYIDKQGKVKKIHTGFNGPATGEKFEQFKQNFEKTITELVK